MAPVFALEPLRLPVFGLAGAVISLAVFLLLQRSIVELRRRHSGRREPVLTRLLYEALQSTPVQPEPLLRLGRRDRKLVRSILLRLALDLRGDTGESISELYRLLGFLQRDLARLTSGLASIRARAAADLGLVRSPQAIPALLKALNDRDVRVRQASVWAVGQVGDPSVLRGLVGLLEDRNLLVAHRAQEVLADRGREVADAIVAFAGTTSSRSGRLAAIELIGWLRLTTAADLLLEFMDDIDPEVRVKSVKAAAAIGDPRFLQSFSGGLDDSSWAVRCQAAKGLSLYGSPDTVPGLNRALRDRHWWVRFYAATALAEAGPFGAEALQAALQDPEPPVRDMARYLLERAQLIPALP